MLARAPGDVTHANVAQSKMFPDARAPTPTAQCSQLRQERTPAADQRTGGGPANVGGVQISQRRAAGMRCAAGQPTMVTEGRCRRSLASGGRHRTVTGGSDAAPAAARIGLVAASATRPGEGAGRTLTPCLPNYLPHDRSRSSVPVRSCWRLEGAVLRWPIAAGGRLVR